MSFIFGLSVFLCGAASGQTAPANDNFANRIVLAGLTNFVRASNVGATKETGEPYHAGTTGGSSVWWTWTAPTSGTFTVSLSGSGFDTIVAIYTGGSMTNLTPVAGNDDSTNDTTSLAFFRVIADETYQIAVDGFLGDMGEITLRLGLSGYTQPAWIFPDFRSTNRISFRDFRNQVVLLDFFETTCGACTNENNDLLRLRDLHVSEGFEIVGVAKDNSLANIFYGIRNLGINYPVLINGPSMENLFGGGILYMPTKFLIDREGKIQMKMEGGNTFYYYENFIVPLLHNGANISPKIRREPGQIVLSWPGTEFGWVVEAASIPSGGPWVQVSSAVATTNAEHTVRLETTNQVSFYRLRKP